ncbi:MAG: hypothetical protein ABIP29_10505, partial [Candidatus Eisenbacteria bacterium]
MSRVRVLVGTKKGAFVMTADGKREAWDVAGPFFTGFEMYHLKGSPVNPDRIWASQTSGWFGQLMQRSDDGGKTWEPVGNEFAYEGGDPGTHLFYDGTAKPWKFTRVWHVEPSMTDADIVYAGVDDAALFVSRDAGATWQEVATPSYPAQPEGAPGPAWKLMQIWSLEAAHGTVWAGTLPGGLFRSADGGDSWQLVESLWNRPERLEWFGGGYDAPGIHSICPHPERRGELLVGVSCGGVWGSRDDGATWRLQADGLRADYMPPEQAGSPNTQDPHAVVRCAGRPDVLWCQHHNGIWRSTDNAASWQEVRDVPLSHFGFAVAVHPDDPDRAWFAPAEADQRRVPLDA